jgi:hypothetical protein
MALIPTYTTPIPAFDLLNELNNIINLINANFAQLTGTPAFSGTFVATGTTAVTVANANILATDNVIISLNAVGGTVGAQPHLATLTAGTGFTVVATASDTSTYNYKIIRNTV